MKSLTAEFVEAIIHLLIALTLIVLIAAGHFSTGNGELVGALIALGTSSHGGRMLTEAVKEKKSS